MISCESDLVMFKPKVQSWKCWSIKQPEEEKTLWFIHVFHIQTSPAAGSRAVFKICRGLQNKRLTLSGVGLWSAAGCCWSSGAPEGSEGPQVLLVLKQQVRNTTSKRFSINVKKLWVDSHRVYITCIRANSFMYNEEQEAAPEGNRTSLIIYQHKFMMTVTKSFMHHVDRRYIQLVNIQTQSDCVRRMRCKSSY